MSECWNRHTAGLGIFSTHTYVSLYYFLLSKLMDALVLENGRVHYSCWTRLLKSLDASSLNCVCVHQKSGRVQLLLWTRLEFKKNASRRVCTASNKFMDASRGGTYV